MHFIEMSLTGKLEHDVYPLMMHTGACMEDIGHLRISQENLQFLGKTYNLEEYFHILVLFI